MDKELNARNAGAKKSKKQRYFAKIVDTTTPEDTAAIQSTLGERQYSCIWKYMVLGKSKKFLKLSMFLGVLTK